MSDTALLLARWQFAFTIAFHIVLPAFTIGLASWLVVLEALWLRTGDERWMRIWRFWLRIFALSFGMGVVSGIVLSYQIGTNWSVFAEKTGPIIGPLMSYEVLSAFFLEAGFLGVMLFGAERVGRGLHFFATCMVAIGTLGSAFWILAANSWMQTPAGHAIDAAGRFVPVDWWAVIFNPSFPYRFTHMVLAAYLTTALVVGAVGARHLLRDARDTHARTMFAMAMGMLVVTAPIQIVAGDLHGLNTLEHQPAKVAALEGHFETVRGAPLYLFGWPDMQREETRFALGVPKLGSLILTHELDGEIRGLKSWPRDERPNAAIVFWSFRTMVGLGLLMLALGVLGLVAMLRKRVGASRGLLRFAVAMGPAGFVAVVAGWITTEVGRQPYTVYGLLRTAESVAPIGTPGVAGSLAAFVVVYLLVFGAGILYLLKLMATPVPIGQERPDAAAGRAAGITPAPTVEGGGAP